MTLTIIGYTQTAKPVYVNYMADHELYSDFNDRRIIYNLTESARNISLDIEYSHISASRNILENELYDFTY